MISVMDSERINKLLDKYWECSTSVEEERELRLFFTTSVIPPELLPYKAWFVSPEAEGLKPLGDDFDHHILVEIDREKRRSRNRSIAVFFCYLCCFLTALLLILCLKLYLF